MNPGTPFSRQNTPAEKIADVERQIKACMRGEAKVITCPYCGAENRASNEQLCCADMGLTVRAILRKQAQQECLDSAARVMDAVAGMN